MSDTNDSGLGHASGGRAQGRPERVTHIAEGDPLGLDSRGILKSPQDFGAGLFLIAFAAIGWLGGWTLPMGKLSGVGSGMMPKVVATLVAAFGVLLIVESLATKGPVLERWALRGPFFVLGAILLFAWTIRPLGLIVAGPLAVMVSAFADKDTRIVEIVIFALVMTALCGLMFKEMLALPIPFDSMGLIPEPVVHAYAAVKQSILGAIKSILTGSGH